MSSLFDTDDDLSLRTRRGAEDRSRERAVEMADSPADREVTLNTGTVLALFFALALICAVFFGFGYSMGRKSTQAPVTAANSATTDSPADDSASHAAADKPSSGSPAIQPVPGYMSQQEANDANSKSTQSVATAPARPAAVTPAAPAPTHTAVATTTPAPVVRTAPPPAAPTPAAAPVTTPAATGSVFVQIAAVSHQEDADVLKSALGRRGYKVVERSDANDRLIHVQIGPFTDRKAAEATRQKLLSDGYNAFMK